MDLWSFIGELSFSPLLVVLLGIVGLVLSTFVKGLLQIILAKPFGLKVTDFAIFGYKFTKLKSGKWEQRGARPGVGLEVDLAVDLDVNPNPDHKKLVAKEKANMILLSVLEIFIGAGIFTGLFFAARGSGSYTVASIFFITGAWLFIFCVGKAILGFTVLAKANSKKSLGGYVQEKIGLIRSGVPIDQLDVKPLSELNYKKVWDTEKMLYFILYFEYLDAKGDFNSMPPAVADIESILKPATAGKIGLGVCMNLTYYYSYHYIVPSKAKEYYHRIYDEISKDTEPNSMIVKGFYELNCFGNVDAAKDCVVKALEKIDSFSVPSEREYARTCIARLNQAIDNFPAQN